MTASDDRSAFDAWLHPHTLVKGGRVAANWLPGGGFWFVDGAPGNTTIQVFDAKAGTAAPMFDTAAVRAAYRQALGREAPGQGLPFEAVQPAAGGYTVTIEGARYTLAADGATLTPVTRPNMADVMWGADIGFPESYSRPNPFPDVIPVPSMLSPDGRWFSSIRDSNIWIRSRDHGRREQLTFDGEITYGWDVASGAVSPWSPDSYKLFVTKYDRRAAAPRVRVRWNELSHEVENTWYARAGDCLPTAAPHVIDILSRRTVRVDLPIEDRMLIPIGWSHDSASVLFVQFSRDMSWAGVYRADAETGAATLLFEETTDTFLRPQHYVIGGRSDCTLLPDGGFLWISNRDGWTHLHHYDAQGAYQGQVTSGDWPVETVQAFDPATSLVYFTAHHDPQRPYDLHLCRVPLAGGEVERLTEGAGVHEAQIAPDRSCFIDTVSRPDLPHHSVLRRASGEVLHRFAPPDISRMDAVGWTPAEEVCVKAADGETDLWGVIYKPRDFDPAKSYPVIECIYGGPQHPSAQHSFVVIPNAMFSLNLALPQLGYVVVMLDARGTPERTKGFMDVVHKEWRRHVTADHAAALRNMAIDRPWMDLDRVGIWGHSWGGYYTFANLIDNPDLFRAGICSAPSFSAYDAFLYEPYLGGPPAGHNRAAYEDANLPAEAGKLQGELMILAGTNDMGVWESAVQMTEALIKAGKPHEMVMLPGQFHMYDTPHTDYFVGKLVAFFDRTVKTAGPVQAARG